MDYKAKGYKVKQQRRWETATNVTDKTRLQSVSGITKYDRIVSEMVERCYHIVELRVPFTFLYSFWKMWVLMHSVKYLPAEIYKLSLYDLNNTVYE